MVGEYSTSLTPDGYAVESLYHPGSVQIYSAQALEMVIPALAKEGRMSDELSPLPEPDVPLVHGGCYTEALVRKIVSEKVFAERERWDMLVQMLAEVRAVERERCAQRCENLRVIGREADQFDCAHAIRELTNEDPVLPERLTRAEALAASGCPTPDGCAGAGCHGACLPEESPVERSVRPLRGELR